MSLNIKAYNDKLKEISAKGINREGKLIGIWIDHRHAIIIGFENGQQRIEELKSDIKSRYHFSGGFRSRKISFTEVAKEKKADEKYKNKLNLYYMKIINKIKDADHIFVIGPGEAPKELQKEIECIKYLKGKVKGIMPADKLTKKQVAAIFRSIFKIKNP